MERRWAPVLTYGLGGYELLLTGWAQLDTSHM